MPYSYQQYTGNNVTAVFTVPFPYLLRSHVKLYYGLNLSTGGYTTLLVDGVNYAWLSDTQVQITPAPMNGIVLTIRRETPTANRLVDWNDGGRLNASDLDTADLQNFYAIQEHKDYVEGLTITPSANLPDGSVTAAKLSSDAVTTAKLLNDAVTTAKVSDGSITNAKLAIDSVTTAKVSDGSITNAKLAIDSVTTAKVSDGSITTAKLAASAVTAVKIADASITSAKIAADAITAAAISNGSVTSAKIAAGAVTATEIQDNSVTRTKIANAYRAQQETIEAANSANYRIICNDFGRVILMGQGIVWFTSRVGSISWPLGVFTSVDPFIQAQLVDSADAEALGYFNAVAIANSITTTGAQIKLPSGFPAGPLSCRIGFLVSGTA